VKMGKALDGGLLDFSGGSTGIGSVRLEVGCTGRLSGRRQMRSLQSPPPETSKGRDGCIACCTEIQAEVRKTVSTR
jgi:hypothetical protein